VPIPLLQAELRRQGVWLSPAVTAAAAK
jgi:hypothetical protein